MRVEQVEKHLVKYNQAFFDLDMFNLLSVGKLLIFYSQQATPLTWMSDGYFLSRTANCNVSIQNLTDMSACCLI